MERERENIHTSGVLKKNGPSLIFYPFFFDSVFYHPNNNVHYF